MRYLVIRYGAYGDMIIITPLLKHLKSLGHEVYLHTSERGMELLKNSKYIDKFIPYKSDSVQMEKLDEFWKSLEKAYEIDKTINLCESIEVALALYPAEPNYNESKEERAKRCNKNYYDYTMEFAGFPDIKGSRGELNFDDEFEGNVKKIIDEFREKDKFVLLWGLTGSNRNKSYYWALDIINALVKKYDFLRIITVGEYKCKLLEGAIEHPHIIHRSGLWEMNMSCLATKYVDLVVAPDTGLLHASGCYSTPKIGLLGHTTRENITKNFENDYSLEAQCDCAPCFRLIYNARTQCPLDETTGTDKNDGSCYCMGAGLPYKRVFDHICEVIEKCRKV